MTRPSVLVVGAGFSGLLTALHLLSQPDGPQVRLVERAGAFGRGVAYATNRRDHLLNVRVANMSAFPDQPDHFVQWLAQHDGWSGSGAFVTRSVYGEYLQSLLRQAVEGASADGRLLLESDEVVDLERANGRWRAATAMGRTLWSDAVVMATGLSSPPPLPGAWPDVIASHRYVADPWRGFAADVEPRARILLLGTGLTMVDVAMTLAGAERSLTAVSRRGLVPRSHHGAPPGPGELKVAGSPARVLRQLRAASDRLGWRVAVDLVRNSVPDIWRAWSLQERRRFLRHARPWWDVHRHRMAPAVARRLEAMRRSGELKVEAGTLERLELEGDAIRVAWRARRSRYLRVSRFDFVVNCTGQGSDVQTSDQPLLRALLRRGLIRPDPCALGADVDERSRPFAASGAPSPGFFAVGPITRGAFWEITSVPDIRLQAQSVAGELLAELRARAASQSSSAAP